VVSALARRHREGELAGDALDRLLARVTEEMASTVSVELRGPVLDRSRALLLRHTLRTGDALQLASCLELRDRLGTPVRFLAFDERLNAAARRERLDLAALD
jgi:hypothetical protein